jgi:hypothetical protein
MQALIADPVRGYLHLAVRVEASCFAAIVAKGGRPNLASIFRNRPYRALVVKDWSMPARASVDVRACGDAEGGRRPILSATAEMLSVTERGSRVC